MAKQVCSCLGRGAWEEERQREGGQMAGWEGCKCACTAGTCSQLRGLRLPLAGPQLLHVMR